MLLTLWLPSECDEIRLSATEISSYFSGPTPDNDVAIEVSHNCETDYEFTQARASFYYTLTEGAWIRIRPTDLDEDTESTKLDDGVYHITVTITDNNGSNFVGSICVYLGCDTECAVIDYLADNLDSDVHKYVQALEWVNTCDTCECENACIIFNYLTEILEGNATSSPCNCA